MTTQQIVNKLKEITAFKAVYYGAVPSKFRLEKYDYAVVAKNRQTVSHGSRTLSWIIYVGMENEIPDNFVTETLIPKLKEIKGLKIEEGQDVQYEMSRIPDTATRIEFAAIYVSCLKAGC